MGVPEMFGFMVFGDRAMKEYLPEDIYNKLKETIEGKSALPDDIADEVAAGMKNWAIDKGATHFCHWFQPMTGVTAEKHDSFISPKDGGGIIMDFRGKELIRGESDASSFPSGGLRATFEARGYTAWDPTSYAFVKENTLCIPTVFCSPSGATLDKKTPLLRSDNLIADAALKILRLFKNTEAKKVIPTVGAEQEYFLIDKKYFEKRVDLIYCGRTLFGAKPPKTQELDDHYYGSIKPRVKEFMSELNKELWKLGILSKTEHNEVAPSQHELAPIYTNTNAACDQNQLTMECMKKVAEKMGLVCLLHEKPFMYVNGSGKHNNWSLATDTGVNLFDPGKNPMENAQFLLFLCAVIKAVDEHQDLLRISVAGAGNDHRLGGNEAPPAIISMFIGDELLGVLNAIAGDDVYNGPKSDNIEIGVDELPKIKTDNSDRNRTSPFAFTGNKFEFRMVGASQSIASANIVLNTITADALFKFAERLNKADDFKKELNLLIKETVKKHKRILFNGNGYGEDWVKEAESRGLLNLKTTADCVPLLNSEKNVALFSKYKIFTKEELDARCEILLENYCKIIGIEAATTVSMSRRYIYGGVAKYIASLKEAAKISTSAKKLSEKLGILLDELEERTESLCIAIERSEKIEEKKVLAAFCKDEIIPKMERVRNTADTLDKITEKDFWPFPTYGDLLLRV